TIACGTAFTVSGSQPSVTVNKAGNTPTAANKTATFSSTDQAVTLTASVTSDAGTVNQGSVTFTVKDSATVIGSTASGSMTGGNASASYTLPGGSAAKTYTIEAAYTSGPTGSFADRTGRAHARTADTGLATINSNLHSLHDALPISSGAGTVNQGSVTFTVKDGATVIGSTASGSVASGNASASYTLPGGSAAKTYTIEAAYTSGPTGSFADSSDNTKTLTVNKAAATANITDKTATYDTSEHAVTLTATLTHGAERVNHA